MAKKTTYAVYCAICAILAIIFTVAIGATVSAAEASSNIDFITNITNANNGKIFLAGSENDGKVPVDFSVSEYIKSYKANILTTDIYARNNSEMQVSESTRNELINELAYCGEQKITVYEDIISSETKIMLERPDKSGKIHYIIYTFDHIHWPWEEQEANDTVTVFNYKGFRYTIFVQDDKFCLTKKWDPEVGTKVYECKEAEPALTRKLQQAFTEGENITFIEEIDFYVRIHAYVDNNGQKEEYIFFTYNPKPATENSQIIATIDTVDDTYSIYVEDGFVCLDSAKRSGWVDFYKNTNE